MRRLWTRVPWQPRRLLWLAAVLAPVWLISVLVGPPSEVDEVICAVGGSCSEWYARLMLQIAGGLAGIFAAALVLVAGGRLIRTAWTESNARHAR